jgi:signal peptidase I
MGYATVMRVPRINNYKEALHKYNNTKPIRGRDGVVPLGERRDADTYSIRKNVWTDAMELVLYKTPVITFTVEDEVKIKFGSWSSASTCQFISRVLFLSANRVKGDVVLTFNNGSKAIIADNEELVLAQVNGRWFPKEKQTLYDYRIDRKEANRVRKLASTFRDYMAGVVKLKGETITLNYGTYYQSTHEVVKMTYGEMCEVFGRTDNPIDNKFRPNVEYWTNFGEKPPEFLAGDTRERKWMEYREKTEKFYDLVRDDQDDNTRHQNYWIAFNILFVQSNSIYWRDSMDTYATLGINEFSKDLDRIFFAMFADKVFKMVPLAEGKAPNHKYNDYVRTED